MQPNSLSRHKDAVPREFAAAPIRRSVALFLVLVAAFTIGIPALLLFMGSIPGRGEVGNSPAHGLSETAIGTMNVFRETQGTFFSKLPEANQRWIRGVSQLESELDEGGIWNSQSRDALRTLLVRIGQRRVGDVEIGHAGTLFFLPDIRHLIGPGFLTEEFLQRRSQEIGDKGTRVQPDSRVAILDFQKQLLNLGIQLIVVPTPSKAAIISEQLSVQCAAGAWALRNSSLEQWKPRRGVAVSSYRYTLGTGRDAAGCRKAGKVCAVGIGNGAAGGDAIYPGTSDREQRGRPVVHAATIGS